MTLLARMRLLPVAALLLPAVLSADNSTGTTTVSATVASAINLTIESSGGITSGTGTNGATADLGSVNRWGSTPSGFTKALGSGNWTLTSTIGVKVEKANLPSSSAYSLTAQLASPPPTGIVWKVNNSTLSNSGTASITTTGSYGATPTYAWVIEVDDTAEAATIDNVITFAATSN